MSFFVDCYGAQNPETIRAQGAIGVIRYVSHQAGKCITPEEARSYRAAGLQVLLVFEDGGARANSGYSAGREDAAFANVVATGIGYPTDCPIYYGVDFEPTTETAYANVEGYIKGAQGIGIRPAGVYGDANVIDMVVGSHAASYGWQTAAWSGGRVSSLASIYQDGFGDVFDHDAELKVTPAWGAVEPVVVVAAPKPVGPHLDSAIVGIARCPGGYWLATARGSIYAFGHAQVFPSAAPHLSDDERVVAIGASTMSTSALWLLTTKGGVIALGGAKWHGGLAKHQLERPVSGFSVAAYGDGYTITTQAGGVYAFGVERNYGAIPDRHLGPAAEARPL